LEVTVLRENDCNVFGVVPVPVVDPLADPSIDEDAIERCDDSVPDADLSEPR
jgi:hypothetical protein